MKVEQLYTQCLAQAAYFIESEGEAAVVDPIRDYEVYIHKAKENGVKIKYIFETHFHADFVSGHIDLAKATGATIVYGPQAKTGFEAHIAKDGEEFKVGNITMRALHTPGHTPESTTWLLIDEKGEDHCIFTGDTLFVGDVGRPDLVVADPEHTSEKMAELMFDSLHHKLGTLSDAVVVYPGHGAGSACGKNLGPETWSTMGEQRRTNYALQTKSKEEFVKQLLEGIAPAPSYFFEDATLNKNGYNSLDEIMDGVKPLDVTAFSSEMDLGALVIDSRKPDFFELGFVKGSVNIGLNGQYAIWAATLLDLERKILLVCEPGAEKESAIRLARVGFSRIAGYLEGGFDAWAAAGKPVDMIISIDADEFALDYKHSSLNVLDVRKPSEWDSGHVAGATNINLEQLQESMDILDTEKDYVIHCAGGYRSMIAASILKSNGFQGIKNVYGGYSKIKDTDVAIEVGSAHAVQG